MSRFRLSIRNSWGLIVRRVPTATVSLTDCLKSAVVHENEHVGLGSWSKWITSYVHKERIASKHLFLCSVV